MTNKRLRVLLALGAASLVGLAALPATAIEYHTVDFSPLFNAAYTDTYEAYPTGIQLAADGVPLNILPPTGPNIWSSESASGSVSVTIPVNTANATAVHTIIQTVWGQPGPDSYAYLEFFGTGGAYFRKDLVGSVDIRDHANNYWTSSINGTTTINFWEETEKWHRLDKQEVRLPDSFRNETLTSIQLVDNGGFEFQRTFIMAATIEVPEPASLIFLAFGGLAAMRRRRTIG